MKVVNKRILIPFLLFWVVLCGCNLFFDTFNDTTGNNNTAAPTPTPTMAPLEAPQPTATSSPGQSPSPAVSVIPKINISFAPGQIITTAGTQFSAMLYISVVNLNFTAYNFSIKYDSTVIMINTAIGDEGVEVISDNIISIINSNPPNKVMIRGESVIDSGAGSALYIFRINWIAVAVGSCALDFEVQNIVSNEPIDATTLSGTSMVINVVG